MACSSIDSAWFCRSTFFFFLISNRWRFTGGQDFIITERRTKLEIILNFDDLHYLFEGEPYSVRCEIVIIFDICDILCMHIHFCIDLNICHDEEAKGYH